MTKRISPLKKAANVLKKAGCSDFLIAARIGENEVRSIIYGWPRPLSYLLLRLQNDLSKELFPSPLLAEKAVEEAQDD